MKHNFVIKRAHPASPAGKEHAELAFAVDAHNCLLFLCKNTEKFEPVQIDLWLDESFDQLYGYALSQSR
jgi:hypothetical protein